MGVLALVLQQLILHLTVLLARLAIHLRGGSAATCVRGMAQPAALSPVSGEPEAVDGAEQAGDIDCERGGDSARRSGAARAHGEEETGGSISSIWGRVSDSSAGIAGVLLLFLHGLSVADVKHCGMVGFAVVLCAAHGRSSARRWRMAVVYLGVVIVLDYLWHFESSLPAFPILGLGVSRGQMLWSWDALGAEMALFVLLACHMMRIDGRRAQMSLSSGSVDERLLDQHGGPAREMAGTGARLEQSLLECASRAPPSCSEPGAQVAQAHEAADEANEAAWPRACQVSLQEVHRLAIGVAALWDMLGFLFVYLAMLVHALGVTQMGTWAFDSGKWGKSRALL